MTIDHEKLMRRWLFGETETACEQFNLDKLDNFDDFVMLYGREFEGDAYNNKKKMRNSLLLETESEEIFDVQFFDEELKKRSNSMTFKGCNFDDSTTSFESAMGDEKLSQQLDDFLIKKFPTETYAGIEFFDVFQINEAAVFDASESCERPLRTFVSLYFTEGMWCLLESDPVSSFVVRATVKNPSKKKSPVIKIFCELWGEVPNQFLMPYVKKKKRHNEEEQSSARGFFSTSAAENSSIKNYFNRVVSTANANVRKFPSLLSSSVTANEREQDLGTSPLINFYCLHQDLSISIQRFLFAPLSFPSDSSPLPIPSPQPLQSPTWELFDARVLPSLEVFQHQKFVLQDSSSHFFGVSSFLMQNKGDGDRKGIKNFDISSFLVLEAFEETANGLSKKLVSIKFSFDAQIIDAQILFNGLHRRLISASGMDWRQKLMWPKKKNGKKHSADFYFCIFDDKIGIFHCDEFGLSLLRTVSTPFIASPPASSLSSPLSPPSPPPSHSPASMSLVHSRQKNSTGAWILFYSQQKLFASNLTRLHKKKKKIKSIQRVSTSESYDVDFFDASQFGGRGVFDELLCEAEFEETDKEFLALDVKWREKNEKFISIRVLDFMGHFLMITSKSAYLMQFYFEANAKMRIFTIGKFDVDNFLTGDINYVSPWTGTSNLRTDKRNLMDLFFADNKKTLKHQFLIHNRSHQKRATSPSFQAVSFPYDFFTRVSTHKKLFINFMNQSFDRSLLPCLREQCACEGEVCEQCEQEFLMAATFFYVANRLLGEMGPFFDDAYFEETSLESSQYLYITCILDLIGERSHLIRQNLIFARERVSLELHQTPQKEEIDRHWETARELIQLANEKANKKTRLPYGESEEREKFSEAISLWGEILDTRQGRQPFLMLYNEFINLLKNFLVLDGKRFYEWFSEKGDQSKPWFADLENLTSLDFYEFIQNKLNSHVEFMLETLQETSKEISSALFRAEWSQHQLLMFLLDNSTETNTSPITTSHSYLRHMMLSQIRIIDSERLQQVHKEPSMSLTQLCENLMGLFFDNNFKKTKFLDEMFFAIASPELLAEDYFVRVRNVRKPLSRIVFQNLCRSQTKLLNSLRDFLVAFSTEQMQANAGMAGLEISLKESLVSQTVSEARQVRETRHEMGGVKETQQEGARTMETNLMRQFFEEKGAVYWSHVKNLMRDYSVANSRSGCMNVRFLFLAVSKINAISRDRRSARENQEGMETVYCEYIKFCMSVEKLLMENFSMIESNFAIKEICEPHEFLMLKSVLFLCQLQDNKFLLEGTLLDSIMGLFQFFCPSFFVGFTGPLARSIETPIGDFSLRWNFFFLMMHYFLDDSTYAISLWLPSLPKKLTYQIFDVLLSLLSQNFTTLHKSFYVQLRRKFTIFDALQNLTIPDFFLRSGRAVKGVLDDLFLMDKENEFSRVFDTEFQNLINFIFWIDLSNATKIYKRIFTSKIAALRYDHDLNMESTNESLPSLTQDCERLSRCIGLSPLPLQTSAVSHQIFISKLLEAIKNSDINQANTLVLAFSKLSLYFASAPFSHLLFAHLHAGGDNGVRDKGGQYLGENLEGGERKARGGSAEGEECAKKDKREKEELKRWREEQGCRRLQCIAETVSMSVMSSREEELLMTENLMVFTYLYLMILFWRHGDSRHEQQLFRVLLRTCRIEKSPTNDIKNSASSFAFPSENFDEKSNRDLFEVLYAVSEMTGCNKISCLLSICIGDTNRIMHQILKNTDKKKKNKQNDADKISWLEKLMSTHLLRHPKALSPADGSGRDTSTDSLHWKWLNNTWPVPPASLQLTFNECALLAHQILENLETLILMNPSRIVALLCLLFSSPLLSTSKSELSEQQRVIVEDGKREEEEDEREEGMRGQISKRKETSDMRANISNGILSAYDLLSGNPSLQFLMLFLLVDKNVFAGEGDFDGSSSMRTFTYQILGHKNFLHLIQLYVKNLCQLFPSFYLSSPKMHITGHVAMKNQDMTSPGGNLQLFANDGRTKSTSKIESCQILSNFLMRKISGNEFFTAEEFSDILKELEEFDETEVVCELLFSQHQNYIIFNYIKNSFSTRLARLINGIFDGNATILKPPKINETKKAEKIKTHHKKSQKFQKISPQLIPRLHSFLVARPSPEEDLLQSDSAEPLSQAQSESKQDPIDGIFYNRVNLTGKNVAERNSINVEEEESREKRDSLFKPGPPEEMQTLIFGQMGKNANLDEILLFESQSFEFARCCSIVNFLSKFYEKNCIYFSHEAIERLWVDFLMQCIEKMEALSSQSPPEETGEEGSELVGENKDEENEELGQGIEMDRKGEEEERNERQRRDKEKREIAQWLVCSLIKRIIHRSTSIFVKNSNLVERILTMTRKSSQAIILPSLIQILKNVHQNLSLFDFTSNFAAMRTRLELENLLREQRKSHVSSTLTASQVCLHCGNSLHQMSEGADEGASLHLEEKTQKWSTFGEIANRVLSFFLSSLAINTSVDSSGNSNLEEFLWSIVREIISSCETDPSHLSYLSPPETSLWERILTQVMKKEIGERVVSFPCGHTFHAQCCRFSETKVQEKEVKGRGDRERKDVRRRRELERRAEEKRGREIFSSNLMSLQDWNVEGESFALPYSISALSLDTFLVDFVFATCFSVASYCISNSPHLSSLSSLASLSSYSLHMSLPNQESRSEEASDSLRNLRHHVLLSSRFSSINVRILRFVSSLSFFALNYTTPCVLCPP